jgi:hypothetical protein
VSERWQLKHLFKNSNGSIYFEISLSPGLCDNLNNKKAAISCLFIIVQEWIALLIMDYYDWMLSEKKKFFW